MDQPKAGVKRRARLFQGAMIVRIQERVLRRYEERCEVPEVAFRGRRVRLSIPLRLDGLPAEVNAVGERAFGGWVSFEVPDAVQPGPLDQAAGSMVRTFARLCLCGRLPDDCDCCDACQGKGLCPAGDGSTPCAKCAGLGYLPDGL